MRHLLLLVLMILSSVTMTAQDDEQVALQDSTLESMPSFPGGQVALFQFLSKTIKYPVSAEEKKIQGRVIVGFYVEADGTITDVEVKKSVDPSLDAEAVRVVKSMPKWNPGKKNGKPVKIEYTLPVTFRLAGGTEEEAMITKDFRLRAMVVFEQDKSTVNKSEYPSIKMVANYILKHPKDTFVIKGYTRMGLSTRRSQKLSEERAKAVKKILVQRCYISANRIIATGMGATNKFDSQGDLNDVVLFYIKKE